MSDERIKQLIDAVINDNAESAEVAFHSFCGEKMKEILGLQQASQDIPLEDDPFEI